MIRTASALLVSLLLSALAWAQAPEVIEGPLTEQNTTFEQMLGFDAAARLIHEDGSAPHAGDFFAIGADCVNGVAVPVWHWHNVPDVDDGAGCGHGAVFLLDLGGGGGGGGGGGEGPPAAPMGGTLADQIARTYGPLLVRPPVGDGGDPRLDPKYVPPCFEAVFLGDQRGPGAPAAPGKSVGDRRPPGPPPASGKDVGKPRPPGPPPPPGSDVAGPRPPASPPPGEDAGDQRPPGTPPASGPNLGLAFLAALLDPSVTPDEFNDQVGAHTRALDDIDRQRAEELAVADAWRQYIVNGRNEAEEREREEAVRLGQLDQYIAEEEHQGRREAVSGYYKKEADELTDLYLGGVYIHRGEREALIALRTARMAELAQTLLLLNTIKAGTGLVPAGSFLAAAPGQGIAELQEMNERAANGDPDAVAARDAFLTLPGALVDANFEKAREALRQNLVNVAATIQPAFDAWQAAEKAYQEALAGSVASVFAMSDPDAGGYMAEENFSAMSQASARLDAARAARDKALSAYLQAINGNALLTAPVSIPGFEGTLWQALTQFGSDGPRAQEAIDSAIASLEAFARSEMARIGGTTSAADLTKEFGSPLYAPLRQAVHDDPQIQDLAPRVATGIGGVAAAYQQYSTSRAAKDKAIDSVLLGTQVAIVGVMIICPVSVPVLGPVSLALGSVEVGVEGARTVVAWQDSSKAEGAAAAGGSTDNEAANALKQKFGAQATTFVISVVALGVDVLDVARTAKAADDVAPDAVKAAKGSADDAAPIRKVEPPRPLTRSDTPGEFTIWTDPTTGKELKIGERLGQGEFSTVYAMADDPTKVYKFANIKVKDLSNLDEVFNATEAAGAKIVEAKEVSDLLARKGVYQVGILEIHPDAPRPYLIGERLPDGSQLFDMDTLSPETYDALVAGGKWTKEHQEAVVGLYGDMADKGVVWFDGHAGNIYFFRDGDGALQAGVLDHDLIGEWGNLSGPLDDEVASLFLFDPGSKKIFSVVGARTEPTTAHEFMVKMFEYKRWITFDAGGFKTYRIDPNIVAGNDAFARFLPQGQLPPGTAFPEPRLGGATPNGAFTPGVAGAGVRLSQCGCSAEAVQPVHDAVQQNDAANAGVPARAR